MAIEAELPDGRILEFPDGTDPSVVQSTVKHLLGVGQEPAPKATPAPTPEAPLFAPKKESVLEGKQMPVEQEVRMGVRPEFINAVQAQLDAMPADKREAALAEMVKREDVYGRAARTVAERYGKLEKIQAPTLKKMADRRLEAGKERFIEQGIRAEDAEAYAQQQALRGAATPEFQQMTPDIVGEQADQAAAEQAAAMKDQGFWGGVGALSKSRATQTGMGLMQVYADMTGDKQFSKDLSSAARIESARQGAIPQGEGIFEKSAQQAMASLATQAPMILLSAMTGSPALALSQAGIDVFGNEYGQGRSSGLSPKEAATRASLMASAEVVFERFGLTEELKAIRGALNKMPTDKIAGYLAQAIAKEIPSEQLTSATQFLIDKTPGIGLNKNAGWKDFWENQAETLRQTVLQAGASSAGVIGTAKGIQAVGQMLPEPREGYQREPSEAAQYAQLMREKGFLTPEAQPQAPTPPATQQAAAPTAETAPVEEPAAITPQVKPTPVDELAVRIAESTGMPIEDARVMAERRAGVESEALGATVPTTVAPTNRLEELTQEFMDAGETPERAKQLATQQVQEEENADELAVRETGAEQPVGGADRTSVSVVGQPSAEPATAGAGVPEPTGVVPAGPTPTGVEGGEEVQPPALTEKPVDEHPAVVLARQKAAEAEAIRAGATDTTAERAKKKAFEQTLASDFETLKELAGQGRVSLEEVQAITALIQGGTPLAQVAKRVGLLAQQAAERQAGDIQNAEIVQQEIGVAANEASAQPEAPKRGRGRPALSEEQKVASEAARKQQRLDANQAKRNVDKAESLLQQSKQPLNEDDYDNLDDLANAQNEQRQKQQAAIRTLYQISRENKGKPGQRAAEILKGANPQYVKDAKTAYEYQKTKRVSRSERGGQPIAAADPKLGKVTNGAQAITQILKSGNAFQKMLARRIRGFVNNVKIVVIEQGQELPEQLKKPRNLREWERATGLFIENTSTRERTVYLRGESFGNDQGVNIVTVLHELLHAATNAKITQGMLAARRGYSSSSPLIQATSDLMRTMASAEAQFKRLMQQNKLPPKIARLALYGDIFEDPREFLAYGMSDPDFQEFLMTAHGYEEDTPFFTRFVDAIRKFFNMGDDTVNALSDLIVVSDKILSTRMTPTMELAQYGMPEQVSAQAKEGERSKAQITKDVSEAMEKVRRSRTAEEYAQAISALHAIKDPTLIIPVVKQAWAYADDKMRNAMAATPTFDFLARWTKDTVPELTNTNVLLEKMSGMSHQLLSQVGRMSEDVKNAFKKDPTLRKKLEDVVYTATLAEVDPGDPNAKVRDGRLDAAYKALGTEGQRIYTMLRNYYQDMTEYYSSLLDKQIEDLDVNDETKKNLLAAVKTIYEGKEKISPYFPLVRRGDFWLGVGTGKTRQFHMFETKAERDNAAKAMAAERRTPLEELLDEKKFSVGNDVDSLRQASYQSSGLLRQIFDAIDNSNLTDPAAKDSLKDAIYQVYLQAMPDQSFRRQFIHRKGITGFSTDLLRNINTTGAKMSVQLARIKYAPLLRNSISQARSSVAPTPEYEPFVNSARNRVNAALTAGRKGDSVDQALEALAGVANKASYIWYLSSAASALIQPFSVYITGLPILTAHHGPKAAKELAKMVAYMNQYGIVRQNADGTRSYVAPSLANNMDLPAEERQAIREMLERGVTQSTYASEVFGYKSTPTESLYFDPTRGVIDNIPVAYGKGKQFANILFGGLMHNTERLSREAIYLASYRLSRGAGKSHDEAVGQAVIDTNEALGNYDMTNRPVLMQKPGGKILLQFQMFPLHTTLLLLTNLKRMLPLLNKEGKTEAAIKFFGTMGTAFSVAGLVGVPGFSAVMGLLGWAWKEFGKDKDWPEELKSLDFETWFRTVFLPKQLGADMANLVEHGPLNAATGLDFASRLSLNNLWGRDTKETKTTRESVTAAALSHAGPTASMILSLADGWDAWSNGDTKRAAEKLTPAAVRNGVIWDRMRKEGIKDYRGAELMSPEAITTGELFGQLIGFRPALSADLQEKNFKLLGIENRILNKRGQILTRMDNAYRDNDLAAYRDAHKDMQDFNKGFPSYRIEPDDLAKSLEKKQEQRGKSYRGVVPTEKNVPVFEEALVQSRKRVQEREHKAHEKK